MLYSPSIVLVRFVKVIGLMDSGSSCLVLPTKDASLFYDAVRKVDAWVV